MSLRLRLLLASAPLALALIGLASYVVGSVRELGRTSQTILAENFRSVLAAQRITESLERLDDAALFVAAGRPGAAREELDRRAPEIERELGVEQANITETGEADLARALRDAWVRYRATFESCTARPAAAAGDCYFAELAPRFQSAKELASHILALNQDAMAAKSERARRAAERTGVAVVVAALAALALGVAATGWLARRLVRPLRVLSQAVEAFGRGDFAARALVGGSDEVGSLAGAFNAMADRIEEYRHSSLGELVQAQQAAQAAMDSLPDPVLVFAPDGEVLAANRAAAELLAAREGQPVRLEGVVEALREAIDGVRDHVLQGKGPFAPRRLEDAVRVPAPGADRFFLPRGEPVYEPGGGIVAATVLLQDVTRLRRFDELRDDLVASVAHQFRTPLTSLRMAVHLCLEGTAGPLTEKQADLLHAAREESERLQAMVDELLDLARLQGVGVELARESLAADALVAAARRNAEAQAQGRGVELAVDPVPAQADVLADPERVQLVFANLLENAIRHSPEEGRVRLAARALDGAVRFEVADEGPGIAPEHQGRIFEKFVRLPGAPPGGAGIGLSLARDLVHAHGGEIGVESEPGRGATFWFTLPRAPAAPSAAQTP